MLSYVATTAGASSVGKHTPYVPDWRATAVATYRPDAQWAWTLAARYSGKMYATVDNTDTNDHTYQGFERFFVMDARWCTTSSTSLMEHGGRRRQSHQPQVFPVPPISAAHGLCRVEVQLLSVRRDIPNIHANYIF